MDHSIIEVQDHSIILHVCGQDCYYMSKCDVAKMLYHYTLFILYSDGVILEFSTKLYYK